MSWGLATYIFITLKTFRLRSLNGKKERFASYLQDEESSFIGANNEIGGAVNGDVTLTADAGPYTVIANIAVQNEDTLTLTAGVVLKFKPNLTMTVDGKNYNYIFTDKPRLEFFRDIFEQQAIRECVEIRKICTHFLENFPLRVFYTSILTNNAASKIVCMASLG